MLKPKVVKITRNGTEEDAVLFSAGSTLHYGTLLAETDDGISFVRITDSDNVVRVKKFKSKFVV